MIEHRTALTLSGSAQLLKPIMVLLCGLLATTGILPASAAVQQPAKTNTNPVNNDQAVMAAYEKLLQDADRLIKNNKPAEAYALLEPYEFEHAGEPRFDYLIGIAALDNGMPARATFALERALAVNPDFTAARLEMGRAYFQLEDFQRAKTEFDATLNLKPSPEVRTEIQTYLDQISSHTASKRTLISGFIELGGGQDSNVNSSTSNPQFQVFDTPNWVTRSLDQVNVKTSDNYYAVTAGIHIDQELSTHWGVYAGAEYRQRTLTDHTQFDTTSTDARAGVRYETQANRLRLNAVIGSQDSDGTRNSDSTGIYGDWLHVFSPENQLSVFAQSMQYRYVDPLLKQNDIDQQLIGIGWSHKLEGNKSSLFGSLYSGNEKDVSPVITANMAGFGLITINPGGGRNDGEKVFSGMRVGGQMAFGEKATLYANAGFQTGDYGKVNYLFLLRRNDQLYDLKLGMDWHLDDAWTVRPQLAYTNNESNIGIYSYDRTDVSLMLRRDFR